MGGTDSQPERLCGAQLGRMMQAGAARLIAAKEHLDRINVFPVADGDTGTNMAMTLAAVLQAIGSEPERHAGRLLTRAADGALDGARGNSGALLAQFLLGLADRVGQLEALTVAELASGCEGGAAYARQALTEPREGTLLTVLEAFAAELQHAARGAADLRAVFARGVARAQAALAATPQQLDVLREAGVVDAGAQGFVALLEGMKDFLDTGEVGEAPRLEEMRPEASAGGTSDAAHRYCTECVVTGPAIDHRRLREELAALGSSLVVAGTLRKARIHLHTNEPEAAFELVAGHGVVSARKVDDMQRQQSATRAARDRRVAIVTDSAADVPDEALERLELHVVPVRVHFGGRSYFDKVSLSHEEFYAELARSTLHPKTSQPPPGDFRRMYEFLASHYESIVSVSLAASVSGTYDAARTAAARLPRGRVTVIDTGNASIGQGLIAMYAAECALAGYDGEEVARAVRAIAASTRTFGLLGDLDFAVRGGRVSPVVRTLAGWLRLVPVLATLPGGRIGPGGALFGRRALRSRFAAFVRRRMKRGARYRVAVGHANAEEEGRRLLAEILEHAPNIEGSWLTALGAALGVHGGPGMLVVGIQEYAPPAPRAPTPR